MILGDKYLVLKQKDIDRFLSIAERAELAGMMRKIEEEREKLGKETHDKYYVINVNNAVADEISPILDKHGFYRTGSSSADVIFAN